jgi:hypothetical protein
MYQPCKFHMGLSQNNFLIGPEDKKPVKLFRIDDFLPDGKISCILKSCDIFQKSNPKIV